MTAPPTAAAEPTGAAPTTIVWSPRKVTFSYAGITTLYSCDGLEGKVREILIYLGARSDAKVSANGCPFGPEIPSHTAWVTAEFSVATPVDRGAATAGAIPAQWSRVELTANRPAFMDGGNCELLEDMKDLVTKNFVFRNLVYDTHCFPHEVSNDDFTISGETPKAAKPNPP